MPGLTPPAPPVAVEQRRLAAADAEQGVAAAPGSLYAVASRTITRVDPTGQPLARWTGSPAITHVNSCVMHAAALVCAASNFPNLPMRSTALWFDPATLVLRHMQPFPDAPGSLTWLDWHEGSWWACFANYDGKGGTPGRDHTATVIVRYSARFAEQARWRLPAIVLARMAPHSASGGAWGNDGLLYVTGHNRPELYALALPAQGDALQLMATIATPTGGQAIAWDMRQPRLLWSIDRARRQLVASTVPPLR